MTSVLTGQVRIDCCTLGAGVTGQDVDSRNFNERDLVYYMQERILQDFVRFQFQRRADK